MTGDAAGPDDADEVLRGYRQVVATMVAAGVAGESTDQAMQAASSRNTSAAAPSSASSSVQSLPSSGRPSVGSVRFHSQRPPAVLAGVASLPGPPADGGERLASVLEVCRAAQAVEALAGTAEDRSDVPEARRDLRAAQASLRASLGELPGGREDLSAEDERMLLQVLTQQLMALADRAEAVEQAREAEERDEAAVSDAAASADAEAAGARHGDATTHGGSRQAVHGYESPMAGLLMLASSVEPPSWVAELQRGNSG
ncbi:hypothetical protein FNF31_01726 [Cafeteria roenbergensis]|uniref:Uncharacterized protein n=1 Tax=Cafeteria roenbergensis TaxID=33653 RepID=A0A5A8DKV1_CAFRO|nr:hypothetical protein FNF31_01726 [Cafeteria roenbergensis]